MEWISGQTRGPHISQWGPKQRHSIDLWLSLLGCGASSAQMYPLHQYECRGLSANLPASPSLGRGAAGRLACSSRWVGVGDSNISEVTPSLPHPATASPPASCTWSHSPRYMTQNRHLDPNSSSGTWANAKSPAPLPPPMWDADHVSFFLPGNDSFLIERSESLVLVIILLFIIYVLNSYK